MNEKKIVENFRSYINISPKNNGEKNGPVQQEMKPKLLNSELVVGEAHSAVMLTPLSERDRGRYGSLFITNYRLSFLPLEIEEGDEYGQRNNLLGPYDVPLTTVGAVYLTDGGLTRRRRLQPSGEIPPKVKGVQVVCKNMKVLTFSFVSCAMGKGRTVAMALLHHAFPKRHDLLFAFEYREPYYATLPPQMNMFLRASDWKRELERCGCVHWRLSCANGTSDAFMRSAGEALLVPASVLDYGLMETARHFRSGSVPIWVWGRPEGAALLRSGELLPTEHSATAESVYLEQVRRSHPKLTPPHVIYLCGNSITGVGGPNILPPLHTLQSSFKRLVELCTPTTLAGFWEQDSQYYSILDNSKWLKYVSSCLFYAEEAATHLMDNVTVVLQEGDGVDYAAVVSSLCQIILDPHYRTIAGFQSLIQKEWIALGHPFCDRMGLPPPSVPSPSSSPLSPIFLLFLDCVWQICSQLPSALQFTETYLTTLWDSANNHLFDTFLFNCPRDRELQVAKNYIQRPVWDWGEQFSEQDIALFYNPLYGIDKNSTPNKRISTMPVEQHSSRLLISPCISSMQLWSQCYERWLLPLQATSADAHLFFVHNYRILQEINQLKDKLSSLSIMTRHSNGDLRPSQSPFPTDVPRFYPFAKSKNTFNNINLDCMQASIIDASRLLDSQSLLNAPD